MRRAKLLTNLLRWRKAAGDKYGLDKLVETLVDKLMLPIAESGWDVSGEEVMRKVARQLPEECMTMNLRVRLGAQ